MEANMNFDNEVLAYLSTRKDELMQQHDQYITEHPEIREVLNDFLSAVLLSKPVSAPLNCIFCQLLGRNPNYYFSYYRTMYSFTPRSTSILSIRLH